MIRRPAITAFQKNCMENTKAIVKETTGKDMIFNESGQKETYYQAQVGNVDIYIYSDAAGFMVNKDWTIFEDPDYSTLDELMNDFLLKLREQLESGK